MSFDMIFNILVAISILTTLLGVVYILSSEEGRREIGD